MRLHRGYGFHLGDWSTLAGTEIDIVILQIMYITVAAWAVGAGSTCNELRVLLDVMGAPLLRLCMYMSLSRPCISTSRTLKCLQSIKELMAEDHSEATSWLWLPSRDGERGIRWGALVSGIMGDKESNVAVLLKLLTSL